MRLINANDVKELLHDILGLQPLPFEDEVDRMVDRLPTAYDVDKVVKEIKANAQTMAEAKISDQPESYKGSDWSLCGHHYYKAISIHKCEEIVRRGGKERIVCFESGNKYYVNDERNNSFDNLVFADSPIEAAYKYCGKQVVRVGRNANCDLIVKSKKGKYNYKISKY